jgi:hypothetical protein
LISRPALLVYLRRLIIVYPFLSTAFKMDDWLSAGENLATVWGSYHKWFAGRNPKLNDKKKDRRLRTIFYRQIRTLRAKRRWTWRRYVNQQRFDIVREQFYKKTRVELNFAREIIYAFLHPSLST